MNESKYKKHKIFLSILITFLIITNLMGINLYILTIGHHHTFRYIGKYYEPEDNFKNLKEYNDYVVTDVDYFYVRPDEWINYCGYNIKTELTKGILINSEEELKELYNKIMKETPNEYEVGYVSLGGTLPKFYFLLEDLIKKINMNNFEKNSLIVYYYDNSTNVCGLKVTDVNINANTTNVNIAISEKKGISSEDGNIGDYIDDNSQLLVIKTEKINKNSHLNINLEKYDCYIKEKEMEGEIC